MTTVFYNSFEDFPYVLCVHASFSKHMSLQLSFPVQCKNGYINLKYSGNKWGSILCSEFAGKVKEMSEENFE